MLLHFKPGSAMRLLHLVFIMLLSLGAASAAAPEGPPSKDSRKWGKTLISEYKVEERVIERMRQHKASAPNKKLPALENVALADTADWKGPEVVLEPGKNPYGLVITVVASALTDGDAVSTWHVGWERDSGETSAVPVGGLNKLQAKAGERFTVTVRPVSTLAKDGKPVKPYIGLVKASNMHIDAVYVQLWSGVPGSSWRDYINAFTGLLTGVVMLLLWWFFRRG